MKRWEHRSPPRKRIYFSSFLSLCILLIFWYLLPLFLFPLQNLAIFGNSHIPQEMLSEQLLHYLKGKPLLQISQKCISSLLRENNWVKKAEIYKIPPRVLLLKVKEKTPFLIIFPQNREPLLIDEEGYVIENPTQMKGLPTLFLTSVNISENNILSHPSLESIEALRELLNQLSETSIQVERILLSPEGEISVFTRGGVEIIIGEPRELSTKLALLRVLWEKIPNIEKRLLYINLSYPPKPAIMIKE